ncbi:hypothetical protein N7471_013404 [Penicillium samsonianum]|uniref:uncharacterized protein n=1 Tax=Penicillium samsonianum TaxID=1882272 RepID=UPI002548275B|nr:uncharacterized protein N7471_013404 [Penicillium samsonianum]KAJ6118784.1 hypothetical protein N7471_013404 [Penicillium samsonianum]
MDTEFLGRVPAGLDSIRELSEEENSINIQLTDDEDEPSCSETESDKAFVVPDDIQLINPEDDSDYEPPDCDYEQSTQTSDESEVSHPLKLGNISLISTKDDTLNPEILGRRKVYRRRHSVTQYQIKIWIDGEHIGFLFDWMRAFQEADNESTPLANQPKSVEC